MEVKPLFPSGHYNYRTCYSLQHGHLLSLPAPNFLPTAAQELDGPCGNQHYTRELLITGVIVPEICRAYHKRNKTTSSIYEGYSKINLRLVGKNKRVGIASKRTLSSNKELLFLLYAYPHTFSPRSVGVNTDKTWTLSSPLPPAVRYVL